ncbi:MAG: DUF2065 domain-containing protein [Alphaproteobacteria bacterium]
MGDLLAAFGLVLVIEGLLYAAAPERMKRMAAAIQPVPAAALRTGGIAAAVLGLILVWLVRRA